MLRYSSDILQNEKVKSDEVSELGVMMVFYMGQGKSEGKNRNKSRSKDRFDEIFLMENPREIEGMFQVLGRFL